MADLSRFTQAQHGVYERALAEVTQGRKRTHWMWFIFPQLLGLGNSATARHYAIHHQAEAAAYLADPVLGPRLVKITTALQDMFINEFVLHFTKEQETVSNEDRIAFIKLMCETGESDRYGHRPHNASAQAFGDLLGQHAIRQFEEGRKVLAEVKTALKRYAEKTLLSHGSISPSDVPIGLVKANWVGKWEWSTYIGRGSSYPYILLVFGPTAAMVNQRAPAPLSAPNYSKVFVARVDATNSNDIDLIVETDVGLDEVIAGLAADDFRLRDSVLEVIRA